MFRIQNYYGLFEQHGFFAVLIIFSTLARLFFSDEPITIIRIVRVIIAGGVVGALTGLSLAASGLAVPIQGAIIGVACILAEDLLTGVFALGKMIVNNPTEAIKIIFSFITRRTL